MDLLLELAEHRRSDLGRMSVRALAEQFVAAMERLIGTVPIGRRADGLVVATRLVLRRHSSAGNSCAHLRSQDSNVMFPDRFGGLAEAFLERR